MIKIKDQATFAGGCFWCMVAPFAQLPGVEKVVSGYTGGHVENPTYDQVSVGKTGHYEAVRLTFDPDIAPYDKLLGVFWRQIDPTDGGGQFHDRGDHYHTAIFYHSEAQKDQARASKKELSESGRFKKPIATKILPAGPFYPAEEYHQDYHLKNPREYQYYRGGSGRDTFIQKHWEQDPPAGLRNKLTAMQHRVTQKDGTEPPFDNEYWNNDREGIYVDVVSGEPLFSSRDKFDSGTGWPSFTKPLHPENITEKPDRRHLIVRTEVRSKQADSHLGHVFPDGPKPTGQRYCINSAALRFIPKEKLAEAGYSQYSDLFQ